MMDILCQARQPISSMHGKEKIPTQIQGQYDACSTTHEQNCMIYEQRNPHVKLDEIITKNISVEYIQGGEEIVSHSHPCQLNEYL